jgi:broad specificity phosphatase PhoE
VTWELSSRVDLGSDRISSSDGERQQRTAAEILRRLDHQPGVILADEVGMGKTFVALAVAVSVIEATHRRGQVLVLVPPSVQQKWPKEWHVFEETCMDPGGRPIRAVSRTVNNGADLLRLLDDKGARRNHIIFATHGAFDRSLTDPWVQLLLVRRAFLRRASLSQQRRSFVRWAGSIIPYYTPFRDPTLVKALLDSNPTRWRSVIDRLRPGLLDDDPVPALLVDPIRELDPRLLVTARRIWLACALPSARSAATCGVRPCRG